MIITNGLTDELG